MEKKTGLYEYKNSCRECKCFNSEFRDENGNIFCEWYEKFRTPDETRTCFPYRSMY